MRIALVPKEQVDEVWPWIVEWLQEALDNDKAFTTDDIKKLCLSGSLELRLIYTTELKGFITIMVFNTPQIKVAHGTWLGGKDLIQWVGPLFDSLKAYFASIDCKQFTWIGRTAWKKLVNADSERAFYTINL